MNNDKFIIFGKTLEEYNKKYKNRRYRLLKHTQQQVDEFDKKHNTKNYLLKDKRWYLINDTYYEVPKSPRLTWFRNLPAKAQIITCCLGGAAIATAVVVPTIIVVNKVHFDEMLEVDDNCFIDGITDKEERETVAASIKSNKINNADGSVTVNLSFKDNEHSDNYELAFSSETSKVVIEDSKTKESHTLEKGTDYTYEVNDKGALVITIKPEAIKKYKGNIKVSPIIKRKGKGSVVSIDILSKVKNEYYQGEKLNLDNLYIAATMSNGYTKNITHECEVNPPIGTVLTKGEHTITVTHKESGLTTSFKINVSDAKLLYIKAKPIKTTYEEDQRITKGTDVTVDAIYTDGTKQLNTSEYKLVPGGELKTSMTLVTVTHLDKGLTDTYSIKVTEKYKAFRVETSCGRHIDVDKEDIGDITCKAKLSVESGYTTCVKWSIIEGSDIAQINEDTGILNIKKDKNGQYLFGSIKIMATSTIRSSESSVYEMEVASFSKFQRTGAQTSSVERSNENISGRLILPNRLFVNDSLISITSIAGSCFRDCFKLTSVVIPACYTSFDPSAFFLSKPGTSLLNDVTFLDSTAKWTIYDTNKSQTIESNYVPMNDMTKTINYLHQYLKWTKQS